jgi:hypothetical protein
VDSWCRLRANHCHVSDLRDGGDSRNRSDLCDALGRRQLGDWPRIVVRRRRFKF